MTGVAALPVMSIPGIATAIPKAGDDATGMDSIFDALIAASAPIASDQPSGQAPAAAQATPPTPPIVSGTSVPPAIFPDAALLEAALVDAISVSPSPRAAPQSDQSTPDTALPSPVIADPAGLLPLQDASITSLPRAGRSSQPVAVGSTGQDTPDASLAASLTMMMLPQLPPAADVPPAPVNPLQDVVIANASNPLPGVVEANPVPQQDLPNAAAASLPADSTAQPAKSDMGAMPAQAAAPFVLSQVGSVATPLPLKGLPSLAAEKPAANSSLALGKTETLARALKSMTSTAVAPAGNAAPSIAKDSSSATTDGTPNNSHSGNETASRSSQDVAPIVVPHPDNLAPSLPSNGYASQAISNHAPIELSGITAANASWAGAQQSTDTPIRLVLSAPGFVPDAASMDALALRIAAKSADGESQFQIRLDPPSLGRIEIHLNMDSQGNAQAQLSADRPQTLDALQRDSGALERALKDAGLDLPGGLSFSLKGDGKSAAWRDSQNSGRGRALQIDAIDAANSTAALSGLTSTGQAWGAASARLDIRV